MQLSKFSTKIVVVLLLVSAAIATLVPYVWARINTGDAWRGVTPELSYDAMYYYTRANDVTRGHFFVTNPYFFEHKNEPSPNPSMDDNIIALPQLLGLSFNAGYYANIFVWALALLLLLYVFFRKHSLSPTLGFLGALWCYLGVYGDMLRPGAMQIIYPLYVLFLLLFWRYLNDKKSIFPLAIVAGITAYFYIFLFMTVAVTLGVYFLAVLWSRNWTDIRRIALTGVIAIGISLPHIIHTFLLASQEFYHETLIRISFLPSHWPQMDALYNGRWIVLVLLLVSLLRRYYPDGVSQATHFFVTITGIGLLLAMVSNIFIGEDFKIAFHVAKFGIIWYLLIGIIVVNPLYVFFFHTPATPFTAGDLAQAWAVQRIVLLKRVCIGFFCILFLYQILANLNRSIPRFSAMKREFVEAQTYAGTLDWLNHQPEGVVIAPEDLNSYIPTLTKQYVLYGSYGAQFTVSDDEVRERFLLAHAFEGLTEEEFIDPSFGYPYGHTPYDLASVSSLRHRLCMLVWNEKNCPAARSAQSFIDVVAMQKKYETYYLNLTAHTDQEYAKYHVRYVVSKIVDTRITDKLPSCAPAYHDQWFEVCAIIQGK